RWQLDEYESARRQRRRLAFDGLSRPRQRGFRRHNYATRHGGPLLPQPFPAAPRVPQCEPRATRFSRAAFVFDGAPVASSTTLGRSLSHWFPPLNSRFIDAFRVLEPWLGSYIYCNAQKPRQCKKRAAA